MDPKASFLPIPYSLDAIEALHSYWNVPYNYIPGFVRVEACDMAFFPIIGDESWKGMYAPTLL
jgi:hypothetical protein